MADKEKQLMEISEEELNEVVGGSYTKDGYLKTTVGYSCEHFVCKECGQTEKHTHSGGYRRPDFVGKQCRDCKWHTTLRCNNPANKR